MIGRHQLEDDGDIFFRIGFKKWPKSLCTVHFWRWKNMRWDCGYPSFCRTCSVPGCAFTCQTWNNVSQLWEHPEWTDLTFAQITPPLQKADELDLLDCNRISARLFDCCGFVLKWRQTFFPNNPPVCLCHFQGIPMVGHPFPKASDQGTDHGMPRSHH